MSKGSKEGVDLLFKILFYIIFIGFILIYWLGKAIIKIIVYIKNNSSKKVKSSLYNNTKFNKKNINELNLFYDELNLQKKLIMDEEIIQKLNLFDTKKYNTLFTEKIKKRGEEYANDNKIQNIKNSGNIYYCEVKGKNTYKVSIEFGDANLDSINNISCTCPYFTETKNNCKHIYALIYKLKCNGNREKILNEIVKETNKIKSILNEYKIQVAQMQSTYTIKQLEIHNITIEKYKNKLNEIVEKSNNCKNEENLMDLLKETIAIYNILNEYKETFIKNDMQFQGEFENEDLIIDEEIEDEELIEDYDFDDEETENIVNRKNIASRIGEYMVYRDFTEDFFDKKIDGVEQFLLWKYLDEKDKKK